MAFHILTFLIIHNVPYLEYKPQNDAGTLLNRMLNLDITGLHTKTLWLNMVETP